MTAALRHRRIWKTDWLTVGLPLLSGSILAQRTSRQKNFLARRLSPIGREHVDPFPIGNPFDAGPVQAIIASVPSGTLHENGMLPPLGVDDVIAAKASPCYRAWRTTCRSEHAPHASIPPCFRRVQVENDDAGLSAGMHTNVEPLPIASAPNLCGSGSQDFASLRIRRLGFFAARVYLD